jgi:hypothetical protein
MLKKKIWAKFQRIIELFTQKIVSKLSKIWVWDPRSGIRKKPIPDPGSRCQKGTGSRIRNTACCGFASLPGNPYYVFHIDSDPDLSFHVLKSRVLMSTRGDWGGILSSFFKDFFKGLRYQI